MSPGTVEPDVKQSVPDFQHHCLNLPSSSFTLTSLVSVPHLFRTDGHVAKHSELRLQETTPLYPDKNYSVTNRTKLHKNHRVFKLPNCIHKKTFLCQPQLYKLLTGLDLELNVQTVTLLSCRSSSSISFSLMFTPYGFAVDAIWSSVFVCSCISSKMTELYDIKLPLTVLPSKC